MMRAVRVCVGRATLAAVLGAVGAALFLPGGAAAQDLYPLTEPPTEVGSEDTGDSTTADASADVTSTEAITGVEGPAPGSTLPFTGGDVLGLVALGGAATAIGVALTRVRRRPIEV